MKTFTLLCMAALWLCFSTFTLQAQTTIVNPSFENNNDTVPQDWFSNDFGAGVNSQFAHSGNYSLAVWNWYYYALGYAVNGSVQASLFSDMAGAGTPATEKALRLTGYYYYDTTGTDTNNDTAVVSIAFRKYNDTTGTYDTVAFGRKYLLPNEIVFGGSLEAFSVDIVDLMPGVQPDTMVIVLQSSINGFCDASGGGNCLYLYVDDLALSNTTGITDVMDGFSPIALFPNPAVGSVTLSLQMEEAAVNIIDLLGRQVSSFVATKGSNTIDISTYAQGMYVVEVLHQGHVVAREELLVQ